MHVANILVSGSNTLHLLWALHFMKVYSGEKIMCTTLNIKCPKTLQKWVWIMIKALASFAHEEVSTLLCN
jgi:hypothetical protein